MPQTNIGLRVICPVSIIVVIDYSFMVYQVKRYDCLRGVAIYYLLFHIAEPVVCLIIGVLHRGEVAVPHKGVIIVPM